MTSERKIAANRMNARKKKLRLSEGGRRRSSRNALQHGFAAVKDIDFALPGEIDRLARAMCGADANPLLLEQAVAIAESELMLRKIRAERLTIIERMRDVTAMPLARNNGLALGKARFAEFDRDDDELEQLKVKFKALPRDEQDALFDREEEREASGGEPILIAQRDELEAMQLATPDLNRLARYERRAWSRQKRAFSRFIEVMYAYSCRRVIGDPLTAHSTGRRRRRRRFMPY
jgi:hypothetical protein